jgi:hypothetical protein
MSSTHQMLTSCRLGFVALVILVLTACSNGGSSGPASASSALAISGSVGDGPVTNAEITFEDVNGEFVGSTTSDASAKYSFEIPAGTLLPVVVRASGGTDLVTGRALDFDLVAVANVDGDSTVNLTPQTTLTVATARCLDNDLTTDGLRQTWHRSRAQIGMGMDADLLPDPMTQIIDADNAANVVLATEALGEIIRRTVAALNEGSSTPVDGDSVLAELGCDMARGTKIDGFSTQGVMRTGAVYRASEAAVLVEVIAGDLQVDGASANSLMDQAVGTILEPGSIAPSVTQVPLDNSLIDQALESILLIQSLDSSDVALLGLVDVLVDAQPSDLRAQMRGLLNADVAASFAELSADLANPFNEAAANLVDAAVQQSARKAPFISLTVDDNSLLQGQSTNVSWASASAERCLASGTENWAGPVSLSGRFVAEDLQHSTQFELRCYGAGGTNRAAIKVLVSTETGQSIDDPQDIAQQPNPRDGSGSTPDNPSAGDPVADVGDDSDVESDPKPSTDDNVGGGSDAGDDTNVNPVGVNLRASASSVSEGGFVTLDWAASNATSCNATNGWTGVKDTSGSTQVGPLTAMTTYTLTCDGAAGTATSIVTVGIERGVVVAWKAPEENTDGSPILALSGYRLFYGDEPSSYSNETFVDDPDATEVELDLAPGSYYLAMSAIAADGTSSALSNEIVISNR